VTNFFQHRPALKVTLIVAAGIVMANEFDLSVGVTTLSLISFIAATILVHALARKFLNLRLLIPVFLFLTLLVLGAWKLSLDTAAVKMNPLLQYAGSGEEVHLTGEILDRPQKKPKTFQFAMRVAELETGGLRTSVGGDLLVYLRRDGAADNIARTLAVGNRIEILGKLETPRGPRDPGDFDFQRYLLLKGISGVVYVQNADALSLLSSGEGSWKLRNIIASIRSRMASAIDNTVDGVEASFLKGILLGDRSDIPSEVKTSFINSGVVHVLAVSGLHVGMVALIFISVFTLLRLRRPWITLFTVVALLFYMLLTGSAPSVVRATIMATVILLAPVFQRKSDVFNSLAFSALVIFFFDAKQLFAPGFQLSFAAVGSILYFYPKIASLSARFPQWLGTNRLFDSLWKLFSVSFAAQVGTFPFTVEYFGRISIISFVVNLLVIPAVGIGLALGFVISLFSLLSSWLASVYGAAEQLLLHLVLRLINFSGNLSFAYLAVPSLGLLGFLIFYLAVAFLFNLKERGLRKKLIFALLILGNIAILPGIVGDTPKVRLTVIDIGQGDASLVQFPSGKALLIDAGPKTFTYDAGEKIVVPFLKRTVRRLDGLLVTHPHSDHLGGVESVLRSIPVDMVFDAGQEGKSSIYRSYRRALSELGIPRVRLRAGDTIDLFDEARVFVLHPTSRFVQRDSLHFVRDFNNGSVVIKILYGKVGLLLTGDAEDPSETQMLLVYDGFLKSNFIKVGHHGSITSSGEEFIGAVKPQYAAISVGAINKFGHPSMEVIGRYKALGTSVSRTDQQGALVYETDGETVKTVEWR
jgi:competence protein ComEC